MGVISLSILITLCQFISEPDSSKIESKLIGSWHAEIDHESSGLWIITDKHFSYTQYQSNPAQFDFTKGGSWSLKEDGKVAIKYEFNTENMEQVGENEILDFKIEKKKLKLDDKTWTRVDNGKPEDLAGAWLITGRKRNGEMTNRTPGARKTMKILSGTKFQWIAYNDSTGDFLGTGGGTYTTNNGKYTENIEFFSRDNTRVGASLQFDFELKDGSWHHSGKSSKGKPIYEIWSTRKSLGI